MSDSKLPYTPYSTADKSGVRRYNFIQSANWQHDEKGRVHTAKGLIYGSWWNDDPLMYMQGQGSDFGMGAYYLRKIKGDSQSYRGGVRKCDVPARQSLFWNTHKGTLQHLHFMTVMPRKTPPTEALSDTTGRALEWIEFAYSVASMKRDPDSQFPPDEQARLWIPPLKENYCLRDPYNAKVKTLFTRAGSDHRNELTPDMALGSILHIIQDSFSPSHTCRVAQLVDGKKMALLNNVYNYKNQLVDDGGSTQHEEKDEYPVWLFAYYFSGNNTYANDPIIEGKWIIDAADHGTDWSIVKQHLKDKVFKTVDHPSEDANVKCI
ncbi:hypothetical protein IB256_15480 [Pseudomonas sp. PDM17]|uniref:hypothetical protein n=1 Tax=Pseudomonas sp. PDM17 TaxID=2769285 RepID=UPI0017831E5B|nr:hypothetical protein [Pseudomonas sp. PDM17]MBD9502189.1 hypothetical protein [Pseudomonas sp. PDM17]